ncbi:MAG TPA: DMT family transporter [Candidatus Limnocylindrales bacterium]|nr:DMT family transporter [Candidatus Limnocylindrales bacterium]
MKPADPAGFVMPGAVRASAPRERRLAEAGVLAVVFLWAGNFVVVKAVIEAIPPVAFTFLRYGLAAVTLLALLRWREGDIRLPRSDVPAIAVLGVIGFGIYQVLWTVGLETVPAGDSALIVASTPVLVAVLAVAAGSDVLTRSRALGALVSFAGVALVVGANGLTVGTSVLGDLLTLGAALCWAIYTAWGAPILRRHSALRTTAWTTVFGTLFLAPIGLAQFAFAAGSGGPSEVTVAAVIPVFAAVVYSGWLAAGFPNVAIFHAVALLGPTRVTAFQFLVPAVTVVVAFVALAEPIRLAQIVGGVVIVAGILVMRGTRPGFPAGRARPERRDVRPQVSKPPSGEADAPAVE